MGLPNSKPSRESHECFFYQYAPSSVYEEFESIREELKHSKKVVRIYAFHPGSYPLPDVRTKRPLLRDLYRWYMDREVNVPFISEITQLCQGEFTEKYVECGLRRAGFVLLIFEPSMEIVGFASCIYDNDALVLHSLCTKQKKGYGKLLVNLIKNLSMHVSGVTHIYLESVPSAVAFYKKLGFEELDAEAESEDDSAMAFYIQ
jgi:hypothetical protein